MGRLSIVCLLLGLLGCSYSLDYAGLQSTLDSNSAKWASKAFHTYTMTYQVDCFCPAEYRDPVNVQVVDSKVKCAVYGKGAEQCGKPAKYNGTVDSLLSMVRTAISDKYCDIQVSYDGELGYPSSVHLASDCGISDIPTFRASNVRPGYDDRVCRGQGDDGYGWHDHHHHWHGHGHRHGKRMWYYIGGGVGLFVIIAVVTTVCCVRRYRRRRATAGVTRVSTKKVGGTQYLNLQDEGVEANEDEIKKVPLV